MKLDLKTLPRKFTVGKNKQIVLEDHGSIYLEPNEQVTFMTANNAEYDVCRKEWGYYATPSMNDRLKRFGFKTALVKNKKGQVYIMIVENNKLTEFYNYIKEESNFLVQWLDEEPLAEEGV